MFRVLTRRLDTRRICPRALEYGVRFHATQNLAAKSLVPFTNSALSLVPRHRISTTASVLAVQKQSSSPQPGLTTTRAREDMAPWWKIQSAATLKDLPKVYGDLSKDKLTAFVVLTAMAGYAIAPGATQVGTLLWTTMGTTLCSASANSFNQWIEVPYDAQMSRTRNRPLARHALAPLHALAFGATTGAAGVASLWVFVNPLTAGLGLANIVLYAAVYTAMKRLTIANTWVGSLVGAIPPLMGWAAATGSLGPGAWVLGGMMFAWQFPHFNSLAYTLRADYSKAGYRMMSVTRPRLNARVSLRYALLMFPLSAMMPVVGLTDPWFLLDSSLINGFMAWCAYEFWKHPDAKKSRRLFFSSLAHLPVLLILIMIHKFVQDRIVANREQQEQERGCEANRP
ncbi:protoheme IX farnesyltransferase [Martensiomyces pterosporus]|nr:protoheme IX farnesyltransferase [Martensiomyces pterosporus]